MADADNGYADGGLKDFAKQMGLARQFRAHERPCGITPPSFASRPSLWGSRELGVVSILSNRTFY